MKRAVLATLLISALAPHARAQRAPDPPPSPASAGVAEPADAPQPPPPPPPGDLDKAADATAAVANLAAPGKPSSDDIDLSSLGLDPGASSFDDKLNIYGFADFMWTNTHWTKHYAFLPDTTSFVLGDLNLYATKNLTPRWRFLSEIRFMYTPNGSANPDGTTMVTTAADATNFGRPIQWGTISVERAYIEYDLHPELTVRVGHWLTPYGIWNIDHGSPVIIGVFRPYVVGDALFPEHQTGLELYGATRVGDYKIGYHATLSNGRSQLEATADTDRRPAFGGRLELTAPWAGTFKLGASAYYGRFTSATTSTTVPPEVYDETMVAGDVLWEHGGLRVQGEIIKHDKAYLEGQRPMTAFGTPQNDGYDLGYYGLIGYRFDQLWNVMPFAFYEEERVLVPGLLGDVFGYNVGLNFRPTSTVVLKLQGAYAGALKPEIAFANTNVYVITSQVACVF